MRTRHGLWLFVFCVCLEARRISAQAPSLAQPLFFIPVGVASSIVRSGGRDAWTASYGLEASIVRFRFDRAAWWGALFDLDLLGDGSSGRVVLGPELGWLVFGVDAGLVFGAGHGPTALGVRGRAHLTFCGSSLYVGGRRGLSFETTPGANVGRFLELGLMLKYPIFLGPSSEPR